MKISKIRDVKTPTRANSTDAGIDFFIPNDYEGETEIFPGRSCLIPSGVKVNVPEGDIAEILNKIDNEYFTLDIGSYPFYNPPKIGTNIVFRCTNIKIINKGIKKLSSILENRGILFSID